MIGRSALRHILSLAHKLNAAIGAKYHIDFLRHYVAEFGFLGAIKLRKSLRRITADQEGFTFTLSQLEHPLKLRPGTADVSTFEKIFVWKQYDLTFPQTTKTILDCGANIGLGSIWFARACPGAKVVAIEPEIQNYNLLKENCAPYSNIFTLNAAVWNRECELSLSNPSVRVDSYQYVEPGSKKNTLVHAYDLSAIMIQFAIDTIDVLKIDIEGAEAVLFSSNYSNWLEKTRMLIIELHGNEARTSFETAISHMKWKRYQAGENEILIKL